MPQYLAPGVYIEEMPGPKPFQAVGTATGAFIGIAERGPIGEAKLVTNWTQFVDTFGGFIPAGYLAYAVNQFFTEGGTKCWVVRTCHYNYAATPVAHLASTGNITLKDTASTPADTLKVEALTPGSWSDHVWIEIANAKKDPAKFRLVVWFKGAVVESYEELTKDNIIGAIGGSSQYIKIAHEGTSTAQPKRSEVPFLDQGTLPKATLGITALDGGLVVGVTHQGTDKFNLVVAQSGIVVERYVNLSMTDVEQKINGISQYIKVRDLKSPNSNNRPAATADTLNDSAAQPSLAVTALVSGLTLEIADGSTPASMFNLRVHRGTAATTYTDLTMDTVESRINGVSRLIEVKKLGTNRPSNTTAAITLHTHALAFFALSGGDDGLANGVQLNDDAATPAATLKVYAFRDGVAVKVTNATSGAAKFKIAVLLNGVEVETFDELIMDAVEAAINGRSQYLEVVRMTTAGTEATTPDSANSNRPKNTVDSGGNAISVTVPTGLEDMDFIGDSATKNGLYAFDVVDDINILAIPDRPGDRDVIILAYTYCQNRKDCFFVADSAIGLDPQAVLAFKEGTGAFAGNALNSSYSALYYPWVLTSDPLTGGSKLVPPSGAVVGTYSSTDVVRGVHKAPAGTIDGYLNSAVGVEYLATKGEQELLNPENINVIRSFPGIGIVVWGARTLSADPEWRYVNIRRLLLFIEETIDENTQWVVFEPNDQSLWARLKRDVSAFLMDVWRSGALFGATAEEAFFVKIDTENNPPEARDAGRLVIDIGVAPVKPAEFVVFRITQQTPKK